jgi:phosphoserine phosphatase
MIKAVVLDIDNTLTNDVSWLKATELLGGSVDEHIAIFDKFSKKELPYETAKAQLIRLWQATGNNTQSFWQDMFSDWPLKDDAQQLVDYFLTHNLKVTLITGSFDIFAAAIATKLGISSWHANTETVWGTDGTLIDFHYVRDQAAQKLVHFRQFIQQNNIDAAECMVIGDGDNDIELFKITGHGIAVGKNNQALLDVSWKFVDRLAEIKAI